MKASRNAPRVPPMITPNARFRMRSRASSRSASGTFTFRYSVTGQLDSLLYPSGIAERNAYDGDGLVTRRTIGSGSSGIIDDTLQYDPLGRVIVAAGKLARTGASQTIHTVYGVLPAK